MIQRLRVCHENTMKQLFKILNAEYYPIYLESSE